MMPAASGAEADVPVCESVHFCLRSVVTLETDGRGGEEEGGGEERRGESKMNK